MSRATGGPRDDACRGQDRGGHGLGTLGHHGGCRETSRELSLVLPSEGHHLPMRDEPPLRWVSLWNPSSELFTLDDAAEGMEREKLHEGFTAALEALN